MRKQLGLRIFLSSQSLKKKMTVGAGPNLRVGRGFGSVSSFKKTMEVFMIHYDSGTEFYDEPGVVFDGALPQPKEQNESTSHYTGPDDAGVDPARAGYSRQHDGQREFPDAGAHTGGVAGADRCHAGGVGRGGHGVCGVAHEAHGTARGGGGAGGAAGIADRLRAGGERGDEAVILSSGMSVRQPPVPVLELTAPENLRAAPNGMEGVVKVEWDTVRGADSYLVECATAPTGPFTQTNATSRARAEVPALTPGTRIISACAPWARRAKARGATSP